LVRFHLLTLLEPIAIMQPGRVVELAELEQRDPASTHIDHTFAASWSAEDVARKMALLVKDAGRHPEHTPRAMQLLWLFGRDDPRPQAQNLDHPLRLLGELGSYETGHLLFCEALLDTIERELSVPDGRVAAAVSLIGPVLAREVLTTRASGRRQVALDGHFIDRKATATIRSRAIALLRAAALTGGDQAVAAVTVLENALHVPFGIGGGGAPKDVVDQWRPEQRELLAVLAEVLEAEPEPSLAARIREVLCHEHEFSRWPASRKRARSILTAHPPDLISSVVHAIEHPWSPRLDGAARQQVAHALLAEIQDADGLARLLNQALGHVRDPKANPLPLLADLAQVSPELGSGLAERAFANPEEPLTGHLGVIVALNRNGVTDRLWREAHPALRRLAASGYAMNSDDLGASDAAVLREMLAADDDEIRGNAILAVSRIKRADPRRTLELASHATPRNAHEVDHLLHGLSVADATDAQLAVFLGWLEEVDHLSWDAGEFIKRAAPRAPDRVVTLLINRAQDARDVVATSPLHGLLADLSDEDYAAAVRAVREAALDPEIAWRLGYLVEPISRGDYSELVAALVEWLSTPISHASAPPAHWCGSCPGRSCSRSTPLWRPRWTAAPPSIWTASAPRCMQLESAGPPRGASASRPTTTSLGSNGPRRSPMGSPRAAPAERSFLILPSGSPCTSPAIYAAMRRKTSSAASPGSSGKVGRSSFALRTPARRETRDRGAPLLSVGGAAVRRIRRAIAIA
jgi:hypothetical protein